MTQFITALWMDESGFILSAELVLVGTIAVLGLVTGLVCVRDSILDEMTDMSDAFQSLDQSYGFRGLRGCQTRYGLTAWTAGSEYLNSIESEVDFTCPPNDAVIEENVSPAPVLTPSPEPIPNHLPLPQASPCPDDAPCLPHVQKQVPSSPCCPEETFPAPRPPSVSGAPHSLWIPPQATIPGNRTYRFKSKEPPLPIGTSQPFVW